MHLLSLLATAALASVSLAGPTKVTFDSNGTQIVGYHYAPASQSTPVPGIVIAHGFGGLQTSRLQPFAQRFADNGYHALTFDYRYWGQSAGTPRNIIDVQSQQGDYIAALTYLNSLPGVDAKRGILWGTSLSGGHVLELAPKTPNLAGVIAQCPHTNGLITTSQIPAYTYPGLIAAATADISGAALGKAPLYIPLTNRTGQFGALTQPGAYEGYQFVQPTAPPPGNVFPARFIAQLPFFSPDTTADKSKYPTFISVGLTDNIVTPGPAIDVAKRMNATLKEYGGGHFSVYPGADFYEQNISDQLAFLKAKVPA